MHGPVSFDASGSPNSTTPEDTSPASIWGFPITSFVDNEMFKSSCAVLVLGLLAISAWCICANRRTYWTSYLTSMVQEWREALFGRPYPTNIHNHRPGDLVGLGLRELAIHCPLDNGTHDITAAFENPDLGRIKLPPELMFSIFKHVDMLTLTAFRRVSKRAMHLVNGSLEYQQIMKRAPQLIRATLALRLQYFTLSDAYMTLSNETCVCCGEPGGFIYLVKYERVCHDCLTAPHRWHSQRDAHNYSMNYGRDCPDYLHVPYGFIKRAKDGRRHAQTLDRRFLNQWVAKYSRSAWNAEHWVGMHQLCEVQNSPNSYWFVSPFFISVTDPLVDLRSEVGSDTEYSVI